MDEGDTVTWCLSLPSEAYLFPVLSRSPLRCCRDLCVPNWKFEVKSTSPGVGFAESGAGRAKAKLSDWSLHNFHISLK